MDCIDFNNHNIQSECFIVIASNANKKQDKTSPCYVKDLESAEAIKNDPRSFALAKVGLYGCCSTSNQDDGGKILLKKISDRHLY